MIDDLNKRIKGHILTVEDPIEFVHPRQKCLISQREIGVHAPSFAAALQSALREDPDVILIGELRDLETMSIAVTAAEMGILVMGTLHTNGAAQTVDRLVNGFPADKQSHVRTMLSTSLRGVISQQLLRKVDGSGRVAALEILIDSPATANLIRQGNSISSKTRCRRVGSSACHDGHRNPAAARCRPHQRRRGLPQGHQQGKIRDPQDQMVPAWPLIALACHMVARTSTGASRPQDFSLRSALPYANGPLHLGDIIEAVQTDVWVRFKMRGDDRLCCRAEDADGTPIMIRAQQEGLTPQALIDARRWNMRDDSGF